MTMGEMASWIKQKCHLKTELKIIPLKNYSRQMDYQSTGLNWINPSPNLSTPESAYSFVGTVLFEGTNISEGRGTTRALELVGHPDIEPFSFSERLNKLWKDESVYFRPQVFLPTFHKFKDTPCGGVQLHVVDKNKANPWLAGQFLCREIKREIKQKFEWNKKPYEYEFEGLAIDFINGTDNVRKWVDSSDDLSRLKEIENDGMSEFLKERKEVLLYKD